MKEYYLLMQFGGKHYSSLFLSAIDEHAFKEAISNPREPLDEFLMGLGEPIEWFDNDKTPEWVLKRFENLGTHKFQFVTVAELKKFIDEQE